MNDEMKNAIKHIIEEQKPIEREMADGSTLLYTEEKNGHEMNCTISLGRKHIQLNDSLHREVVEWVHKILRQRTRRGQGVLVGLPRSYGSNKPDLDSKRWSYVQWARVKMADMLNVDAVARQGIQRWLEHVAENDTGDSEQLPGDAQRHQGALL
jgi:hypothetical protein